MENTLFNQHIYYDTPTTPLTATEEQDMIRRYQSGDPNARRRLIESNLRFVIKMALNYRNQGLSLADLIQEGNLGLIEALDKFDPAKLCRVITYASWWIRLYMQRAIEQKSQQINLPINKTEILRKIRGCQDRFMKSQGRLPSHAEISDELGIEVEKVEEIHDLAPTFHTLHGVDEDHPGWESILVDEDQRCPRETVWNEEACDRLAIAMQVLNRREREVLQYRYNLDGCGKKLSLRKVGQLMGLSAEGVRRIEEQAMDKLRRPAVRAKIEPLFAA